MRPWLTSGRLLPGLTARRLSIQGLAVQLLLKTTNAETAEHVGIQKLKQFHMVNTNMFRHPKYYKELRKRNKPAGTGGALCVDPEAGSDQAISEPSSTEQVERAPGPGLKLPGPRPISNANKGLIHKRQAASFKHQADQDT